MKRLYAVMVVGGLCVSGLTGCEDKAPTQVYSSTAYVFGTLVDITIRGVAPKKAEAAVADLSAEFQTLHNDWHAWRPLGDVSKINEACQTGKTVSVQEKTIQALRLAKSYEKTSHGLFNAAIGQVIGLWGFHSDELPKGKHPSFQQIDAIIAQNPSMADIHIDGSSVRCSNPAVALDFGGFGKGAALDWALKELKSKGITNAVLNAGGDVSTEGHYVDVKDGRPWRIGIRHPKSWGTLASVDVAKDEAVYTSGNYERYNEQDGIKYSHIIDPRTGRAVQAIVSSTVIHKSGALADAAATALSVAGPREWPQIAADMGVRFVLLVDDKGRLYATPDMAKRLVFEGETKPKMTVIPLPARSMSDAQT